MSPREVGIIAVVAAIAVAAFVLLDTDISSADAENDPGLNHLDGERSSSPDNIHAVQNSQLSQPQNTTMSLGRSGISQSPTISNGAEPHGSFGVNTQSREPVPLATSPYVAPTNKDIYEMVRDITGTSAPTDTGDCDTCSTTALTEIDEELIDDAFLLDLADTLDETCPALSSMIRELMELRDYMASVSKLQDYVSVSSSASGKKTEETDAGEETEENEVATSSDDDEEDAEVEVSFEPATPVSTAPVCVTTTSCVVFSVDACCHQTALSGPVL